MKKEVTDRRIAELHKQIKGNVREIMRLEAVIEDETCQILNLCGLDAQLMGLEVHHGSE